MDPYAAAFLESRRAIIELVDTCPEEEWLATSPLTPQWRVRDVLAHLVGVGEDIAAGRFPSGDMNAWTAAHVERGRDLSVHELAQMWSANTIADAFNEAFAQMLFDQITHEYDIRYALGRPGSTDTPGIRLSVRFAKNIVRGERPVVLWLDGEEWRVRGTADEENPFTLTSSHFEFLRAATGRRSLQQIRAMDWSDDVTYVENLMFGSGFFSPAPFDVVEDSRN